LGGDYQKTMLEFGVWHPQCGTRLRQSKAIAINPIPDIRPILLMASERLFLLPMSELLRHQSD
jgi:hypothetical protein